MIQLVSITAPRANVVISQKQFEQIQGKVDELMARVTRVEERFEHISEDLTEFKQIRDRMHQENQASMGDLKNRMSRVERFMWIAAGAFGAIEFILKVIGK